MPLSTVNKSLLTQLWTIGQAYQNDGDPFVQRLGGTLLTLKVMAEVDDAYKDEIDKFLSAILVTGNELMLKLTARALIRKIQEEGAAFFEDPDADNSAGSLS